MERHPALFFAFPGQSIAQNDAVVPIREGFQCWNLKRFERDNFIEALKAAIPPVNDNVLHNYAASEPGNQFGVSDTEFQACSWGLLIPQTLSGGMMSYPETLFVLNLYSPEFLYPAFWASDFGIIRPDAVYQRPFFGASQNQADIFKRSEFTRFYEMLLPQSQYANWQLDRSRDWTKEEWRLYVAALLYLGLQQYDKIKNSFGWQRESADMAALLEALFTAADQRNEEISYRLRKRVAAMLVHRFPTIERDITELYAERSAFVHGAFFADLAKRSKKQGGDPPSPDFGVLEQQKHHVRYALSAYLYLALKLRTQPSIYNDAASVMIALENAIINVDLRLRIIDDAEKVLSLLPLPNSLGSGLNPGGSASQAAGLP